MAWFSHVKTLSSLRPLFLSVSVIWLTWHWHMCETDMTLSHVQFRWQWFILFGNHIIIINWILSYLLMRRFQQVGVTMKSPFANWSSRLVSTFYHLLLHHITCRTLHVTRCILHLNTCIDALVSKILLFVLFRKCCHRVGSSDPSSYSFRW